MYDSRTDKARKPQHTGALRAYWLQKDRERDAKFWCPQRQIALAEADEIEEQILVMVDLEAQAATRIDLDRLHGEALRMHETWCDEREEADAHLSYQLYGGYEAIAMWEWQLLTGQDGEEGYGEYVEEFEQQAADRDLGLEEDRFDSWDSDDVPNQYSHDDCWLPLASIEQCREIFGGTDFIIQHSNVRRRTA